MIFFPTGVKTSECQSSNDDSLQENCSTSVSILVKEENREGNDSPGQEGEHERPHVRRRSTRFKPVEPEPSEDLLEIPEEKVSIYLERRDDVEKNGLNSTCLLKSEEREGISVPVSESREFG